MNNRGRRVGWQVLSKSQNRIVLDFNAQDTLSNHKYNDFIVFCLSVCQSCDALHF